MKQWFNKGVKQYLKIRYNRIENMRNNAPLVQRKVLISLLSRAKSTAIGNTYSFKNVTNYEAFKNNVPLTDYEDIKHSISKMMKGEKDELWPGKVKWFSKSSGTTSDRSKYIPVSDDSLYKNNVAATWDTMAILYHEDPQSEIFQKKNLVMGGAINPWEENPEVTIGDVSAILLHRMPAIGRPFYTPDFKTACLHDWEEKIRLMTKICSKEDVVMFGGVPTWTIVLFKRILEATGASNMHEVWPNVRYYLHGGVGFGPYVDQFKEFFPDPSFKYLEVYNASEGYFAVQDRADEKGMLLMVDNDIFYEFISMEELTNENPEAISIEDVEVNKNYAIVVTTSGGLWRYMPGDTIKFTSINPYRIKVSGRTKHFINVFGEEVMVGNTEKALSETINALPAIIKDYTVAPIFMNQNSKGGHQWLIEFEKEPDDLLAFELLLDDTMKKVNSDYAAKRYKDIALSRLQIISAPEGTFMKWLASKGKVGGQYKIPRLSNNRQFIEELLSLSYN